MLRLLPIILAAAQLFPASAQTPRRVDDAALKNASKTPDEWLSYGFTPQETRYSPLNQINATNVNRMGLAWSYDAGKGGGGQEATPLIWNNSLFSITNWSIVFALDARTGKEKWRWDPEVNQDAVRGKICCGVVHRGLAMYQGLVIAPIIDGRLVALDAETGKPVWEARVSWAQDNYTVTMAPRIAKGKVIIGVSGAELPTRGFFAAYDAKTGAFAWKFYTVPGDPSKPFENAAMKKAAETWEGDFWKLGGGGSVWDGMAYDPDADLLYVGTGNGGPWPEQLRKSKGKDNLFLCSIVAVKPDTGEYKWHFQMVPGDSWDYDSVQQLMLADLTIRGQQRKVIMQANKNGFYYVVDRLTGQFISGAPWVKLNWAKGLDEKTGRPFINPQAHYEDDVVSISPGPGGAHNWAPMSFNPTTGLIYIPTTLISSSTFAVDREFKYTDGKSNIGIKRGAAPAGGGIAPPIPATVEPPPFIGPEHPADVRSALVAWDPVAQKERWYARGGGSIGGGTVTTAGNLVIQVLPDGHMVAYSADKGEKLLDVNTGLRGGMAPPVTYQVDGKQYIALMGGTGIVVARYAEPGAAPPSASAQTVFPKVMAFVLDGKPLQ
jgi:PQQ-dependent dehydrogenase (methanol/ethanol family)